MSERKMRVLSIGAHPDDADTSAAGLLTKLKRKGWEIRLLSVTDGSAGTYHMELAGQELNLMRRAEAAASGARLGARYDVLDHPDGRLEVTLEIREELMPTLDCTSQEYLDLWDEWTDIWVEECQLGYMGAIDWWWWHPATLNINDDAENGNTGRYMFNAYWDDPENHPKK